MPSHTVSRPVSRVPSRRPTEFSQWGPLVELFAHGEDGFLFGDWSELDELFTTSTGTTAVAADNDAVGLALDDRAWGVRTRAQQLAIATELVTNGGFDTDVSGWPAVSGSDMSFSQVGGKMRMVRPGALIGGGPSQTWTGLTVGRSYVLQFTSSVNRVAFQVAGGAIAIAAMDSGTVGAKSYTFVAGATSHEIRFWPSYAGDTADADDVSLKALPGNHALQATTTQRPLWRSNSGKPYLSFDGSDDRLVTPFLPSAALTVAYAGAHGTNATRAGLGGGASGTSNRLALGVDDAGKTAFAWGSRAFGTGYGSDIRSTGSHVLLLTGDATSVDLYLDGVLLGSEAPSGTPNGGSGGIAIGAWNNAGTPTNFLDDRLSAALALNRRVTPAEIALITSQFRRTY